MLRHWQTWALVYAGLVLLTQTGSLVHEITNWDENTFMLLGEDLLDGTLPYIERFDNKPPLIFFLFAGWMGIFGETVAAARALGDVSMWITALLIFAISRRFASPLAAGLAGAVYIGLHSVEPGFHTTAGLPAMAMIMAALWLILARRENAVALVLAGVLVSLAVLTRSNLAYVALASGVWILLLGVVSPKASRLRWWSAFAYGAGGVLPVVVLVAIYAQAGAVSDLKLASLDVALSYSDQWGVAGAALGHLRKWGMALAQAPFVLGAYTLLCLWALARVLRPRRDPADADAMFDRHDWGFVWVFLLAVLWSILKSGAVYPYYWQQFFPLTLLLVADLITRLRTRAVLQGASIALAGISLAAALVRTAPESLKVLAQPGYARAHHDVRAAGEVLAGRMQPGDRVWALDRHLILVYLDLPPISRAAAHPSNISREAILKTLVERGYAQPDELGRIMDSLPEFVVSNGHADLFYFRRVGLQEMIFEWLETHYDVFHATPQITLYQRKPTQG